MPARDTSAADVSAVIFNIGDPGDDIYGKFNLDEVLLQAEEARFLRHEHDTTEIYPRRRDKEINKDESGFIPLRRHTHAHMQDLISQRQQLHRPITGTLNCPSAPFSLLSSQSRGLFERRQDRVTAIRDILTTSADMPTTNDSKTVTYEPLVEKKKFSCKKKNHVALKKNLLKFFVFIFFFFSCHLYTIHYSHSSAISNYIFSLL
jgi:hypothetical protein